MNKKIIIFFVVLALIFSSVFNFYGATAATTTEETKAEELGVKEPSLLPTSPFYFIKKWRRGVESFFAFGDSIKKMEIKAKHASERLLEIRKMAKKGVEENVLNKATDAYEKLSEKVRQFSEKVKEKAGENEKAGKFLDKYTKHIRLHGDVLEKVSEQVPDRVKEKIREAKEKHLENFSKVMIKLEDRGKIKERLKKGLQGIKEEANKELKDLKFLEELEEKSPKEIKDKIMELKEEKIDEMRKGLETIGSEAKKRMNEYIEKSEKLPETGAGARVVRRVKNMISDNANESSAESLGEVLSEKEALLIARAGECSEEGEILEGGTYNENSNSWWFELKPFEEEEACDPACVVSGDKESEVNWRCRGLIPSSGVPEDKIQQ